MGSATNLNKILCAGVAGANQEVVTRDAQEKRIKIGAKVVSNGRYVTFQLAEVGILRDLFAVILRMLPELWPPQAVSTA